jgi:hypothetical protein
MSEASLSWWDLVEAGEREVDADLVKTVAKEVNKRRKQLEASRASDADSWRSLAVRDFEHSTAETALNRAANRLKTVRDVVR